jgi:multidrug efflux pump
MLDPQKMAERELSASDVVNAIRAQNVQAAAGVIGSSPGMPGLTTQLSVNAQGRLQSVEEFGEIVVKTAAGGAITRLRDVARTELGAADYSLRSLVDNKIAAAAVIFQAPGSNAIQIADNVRRVMGEIKQNMPDGVTYKIVYDTTQFVRASIDAVVHTLLDAIVLVVIVVVLFLQTWRASIIPLVAVPVSIVGTFGAMHLLGFSINALSLFGLVLAIGIVVDDAIVVVENVERNIEQGHASLQAAGIVNLMSGARDRSTAASGLTRRPQLRRPRAMCERHPREQHDGRWQTDDGDGAGSGCGSGCETREIAAHAGLT